MVKRVIINDYLSSKEVNKFFKEDSIYKTNGEESKEIDRICDSITRLITLKYLYNRHRDVLGRKFRTLIGRSKEIQKLMRSFSEKVQWFIVVIL